MNTATLTANPALEVRTISVVGLVHGTSHFFHLLLPPLFPWLMAEFSTSYTQLGLLMTMFFVVSAIGQAASGFLVDRVGPVPVLFGSLGLFVAAALLLAIAPNYETLLLVALLAGAANSPFHPVDFTILNQRVGAKRIGHAFSTHGISGNLGWALAPVYLAGIAGLTGSWRLAALAAALLAAVVLVMAWWQRDVLHVDPGHLQRRGAAPGAQPEPLLAFLRLPALWFCFLFFFFSTIALGALQGFLIPALKALHDLPMAQATLVLSGYMVCGALGMVVGGFLVARVQRLERVVGVCLAASALLIAAAGIAALPGLMAAALVAIAGIGVGLAGPSRDLLIKRSTPPGATGRVYGTVYSGLDTGLAVSPLIFGPLLDSGSVSWVFFVAAGFLVLAIGAATWVGQNTARAAIGFKPDSLPPAHNDPRGR